jgi:PhoH-like ATPase
MPLPPIPTQAADKVNISRQPKADLKKRPKRIEVEEVEEVTELAEGSITSRYCY